MTWFVLFSAVTLALFLWGLWSTVVALPALARQFDRAPRCGHIYTTGTGDNSIPPCVYRSGRVITVRDLSSKPAIYVNIRWPNGEQADINLQRENASVGDPLYFLHPSTRAIVHLHDRITVQYWKGEATGGTVNGIYHVTADNPDYRARTAWFPTVAFGLLSLVGVIGTAVTLRKS